MGLLVTSTATAAVGLDTATDPLDDRLDTTQETLDALVPGPIRASPTTAFDASLPGAGEALDVDTRLVGQAPALPQASVDLSTPVEDRTPRLGAAGFAEAPSTAHGSIQPATLEDPDPVELPDYVTGDAPAEGSEDPTADASTQSQSQASPDTSSSAGEAWNNLDSEEKAAVAAGALGLLVFGPLALYSRIQRDDALENDTRREVYEIVETNPGICIQDVADQADVSYSTASYHLKRLVRMDYVTRKEDGNKVLYYKNGGTFTQEERDLIPVLQNEEAMRVFQHIVENPWCYRAQVAEALDVSHTTVNWHLDRLQDADLVDEHREGRSCHLHVDEEALDRVVSVMDKLEETTQTEQVAPRAQVAAA